MESNVAHVVSPLVQTVYDDGEGRRFDMITIARLQEEYIYLFCHHANCRLIEAGGSDSTSKGFQATRLTAKLRLCET